MSSTPMPRADAGLVNRLESHSIYAWPPDVVRRTPDGWMLRAMPGLARGRSNHALTPCRSLSEAELEAGLAQAGEFAREQGIGLGLQVSPIDLHIDTLNELAASGWDIQTAVQVLTAPAEALRAEDDPEFELVWTDEVDEDWLDAWAICEPERAGGGPGMDVESHRRTVFRLLAGRAQFCRHGDRAVGIAVESDDIVGLFCLAVAPHARRQGLGKALVRSMMRATNASLVYLQVFSENVPGLALYRSLGFSEAYRYCHCVAPESHVGGDLGGELGGGEPGGGSGGESGGRSAVRRV